MTFLESRINPGDRPSRLTLARLHAGELPPDEAARVRAWAEGDPEATAFLRSLADAVAPPFDAEVLRKRAFRLEEEEVRPPRAVRPDRPRRVRWFVAAGLAAAAALALVAVLPGGVGNRAKGEGDLGFYVLRDGVVHPGDEREDHRAGDAVQFTVRTTGARTLVLLSVDGGGGLQVWYPTSGDAPLPVVPGERRVLPGSITLDDSPGFELFLAFFDPAGVDAVVSEVEGVLDREGVEGLERLAAGAPDVDAVLLRKAPAAESGDR